LRLLMRHVGIFVMCQLERYVLCFKSFNTNDKLISCFTIVNKIRNAKLILWHPRNGSLSDAS